jgi:hypothetical protein
MRQPDKPPEPTREQLVMAYRHLARPGWPGTLDAAMAHATYSVCIRGLARQLNRTPACVAAPVRTPKAYVPPTPTAPRAIKPATPKALRFDARRAAANDFDD